MALSKEDKQDVKKKMGKDMARKVSDATKDNKPAGWFERKYGGSPAALGQKAAAKDNALRKKTGRKSLTEEHKKKISNALKGRKKPPAHHNRHIDGKNWWQ